MSKADIAISQNLQRIVKELDGVLSEVAGERVAFSLIVFSGSDAGQTNYAGNCKREDAAKALREVLNRWEMKDAIDVPAHHKH